METRLHGEGFANKYNKYHRTKLGPLAICRSNFVNSITRRRKLGSLIRIYGYTRLLRSYFFHIDSLNNLISILLFLKRNCDIVQRLMQMNFFRKFFILIIFINWSDIFVSIVNA